MSQNNDHFHDETEQRSAMSVLLRTLIVIAILAATIVIAYTMISNPAQTKKKEHQDETKAATIVQTQIAIQENHPIEINLMGQVIPSKETELKARVSGEITDISNNFIPGGLFTKDESILNIDPADYDLDIKVKTAALRQANAALRLELGQQQIAKDELKIIEQSTGIPLKNKDLALRKPQLEQARANRDSARAALELAKLNLERTKITAPFSALVKTRNANIGHIVSTQDTLATLVSTDEYWIDVEIPMNAIQWLDLPTGTEETGSSATILLDNNRGTRTGNLLTMAGAIDEKSRLGSLIIQVPDPFSLQENNTGKAPLVLGDYVQIKLIGKTLQNAVRVSKAHLRDRRYIWLARDGKLKIQPATIAYQDRTHIYISNGITAGDQIITSQINTAIDGMDIKIQNNGQNNGQ